MEESYVAIWGIVSFSMPLLSKHQCSPGLFSYDTEAVTSTQGFLWYLQSVGIISSSNFKC